MISQFLIYLRIHGQSHPKSETEGTSGGTKNLKKKKQT